MKNHYLFIIIITSFLAACNTTKYVPDGRLLYKGAEVEFVNSENVKNKKALRTELVGFARPEKNSAFKLWVYNTFRNPNKEKGLGNWIAKGLGEEPVLFQAADAERSQALMENYLHDNGHFGAEVTADSTAEDKTVTVKYNVQSDGQYKIRDVYFPPDSSYLTTLMNQRKRRSQLKTGQDYQLAKIQAERVRLSRIARENGYFGFDQNYIYFFVDTTLSSLQADIYLRVKPPTDSTEHDIYYMDTSIVYPTYDLEDPPRVYDDTVQYQDVKAIEKYEFVNVKTLKRSIAQDKGVLYKESLQDRTVNHLLDLGIFKFVNVKYQVQERNDTNYLQRFIYLTPALTRDITAEIEANTGTSSNSLGSSISGSYTHRNVFRGAEQFNARISAGVGTQLGGGSNDSIPFLNTLEFSAQASLYFPRFIVPFRLRNTYAYYVPKTRISITDNFQRRVQFFTINSFQFEFGYEWQESRYRSHAFSPLNINLVQLLGTSPAFDTILNNNPRLRQGFSNTSILGLTYEYTYTNQEINTKRDYLFFRGGVETSGNLVSLLASRNENGERRFLGTAFSQFLRFDTETRYNILNKSSSLVGRLLVGVGFPYNNSRVLPYIRQFFVGGANSIRAFQIRGVGPGIVPPDTITRGGFFDQTGDIKLEANLEYRFDVFSILKGAVFADAGNIWLVRNDNTAELVETGGEFNFNTFHEQLAVGTGVGIRLDLTFLLLRLDIAFPIRKPYLPVGERWTLDEVNPLDKQWRKDNLVYNIAIGYPF